MAERESTAPRDDWRPALLPVALALAFHLPVLLNGLVWDDRSLILNNPRWGGPHGPWELFTRDYGLDLGGQARGYYRPLFTLGTWLLYKIGGDSAVIYHGAGLLAFCIGIWFVLRLFRGLLFGRANSIAIWAAAICAAHPLHTEVVAIYASLPDWIRQLAATLSVLFMIKQPNRRITPALGLGAIGLAAGLTKESAVFLLGGIALAAASCAAFDDASDRRGRIIQSLALLLGLGLSLVARGAAGIEGARLERLLQPFTPEGAGRSLGSIVTAFRLLAIPTETVFIREIKADESVVFSILMVGGAILIVAGIILLAARRRFTSAIMLGWLGGGLFSLCIATASGLPFSERYVTVIPAVYFAVIVLAGVPIPAKTARLAAAAFIGLCGVQSILGTLKCRDSVTFFASLHHDRPGEIHGMTGLADALYWDKGDFEGATRLAEKAISTRPDDPTVRTMGQLLARIALLEGRPEDALEHLEWAEAMQPDYPVIANLRADALARLGRGAEALAENARAIGLDPANPAYHVQRARLLLAGPAASAEEIWSCLETARKLGGRLPADLDSRQKVDALRQGRTEPLSR